MTPKQCRAARMAVGLSAHRLGKAAGLTKTVVLLFETGELTSVLIRDKLQQTLEAAGIEFVAANGSEASVRLGKPAS